jgi:hypothetical protein
MGVGIAGKKALQSYHVGSGLRSDQDRAAARGNNQIRRERVLDQDLRKIEKWRFFRPPCDSERLISRNARRI